MLAIPFEGSRAIGKPKGMTDEECSSLEIHQAYSDKPEDHPAHVMTGVAHGLEEDSHPYPFTLSYWVPSKEDIEAFQAGRGIWVRILSHRVYPMALFTLNENGEIN